MAEKLTYTRCGDYYISNIKRSYTEPIEWNRLGRAAESKSRTRKALFQHKIKPKIAIARP